MKKRVIVIVAFALIFGAVFSTTSQALSISLFRKYFKEQGGAYFNLSIKNLGSPLYWEDQIKQGRWTGETAPKALMGDANIDGKVTAVDALFALHFAVNGNIQTDSLTSGIKTPPQMRLQSDLIGSYQNGTLKDLIVSANFCKNYCAFNSPFFADVTKDCLVNAKDALKILQYCVGKGEDFPEGDFTFYTTRFSYIPWPTEYYPGIFEDLRVDMTDEEFCEKYNFSLEETPTDVTPTK